MSGWKGIIAGVAPALATALGGPGVGSAVRLLSQKLLGRDDATAAEVEQAVLGATPEQIESLRRLDQEFILALTAKAAELERIEADDRANARAREIATKDHTTAYLAGAITIGFFLLLVLLAFRDIPSSNKDVLMAMVGVLGTAWVGVTTYYFGTSSGSKAKDAVIGRIAGKK